MIPILDLTRQYQALKPELEAALLEVAESGQYVLGKYVERFEGEIAQFLGVKHAIGCANGSDALYIALEALGIGEGDEVITTPFTFVATSESVNRAGATPVFVDIDPDTFNLDIAQIEAKITPNTKAIMPVHLYGQPADMDALMAVAKKHNLFVVEDCAQSIGATVNGTQTGNIGTIGCFSFFPTKNLGAMGDGGLLTTNDDALAEKLKMIRVHGSKQRYLHEIFGINSRLDAMQAAVLSVKLKYLNQWNQKRRDVAQRYTDLLKPLTSLVQAPVISAGMEPVFHQYTIRIKNAAPDWREQVQTQLKEAGVMAMIYYPIPQYKQPTHAHLGCQAEDFPNTEHACREVLSLPIFPEITPEEQKQVVDALAAVLNKQAVKA